MGMVEGKVVYGFQVNKNIIAIFVERHLKLQIYSFKTILYSHKLSINNKDVALLIFHALKISYVFNSQKQNLLNLTPLLSSPSNTHIEARPSWDFQFTLDESFILTLEEQ